jgi:glycosyltransferase involved in cell wall biosynthesis
VIFEIHDAPASRNHQRHLEDIVRHPLIAGVVVLNESVRALVQTAGGRGDSMIVVPSAVDPAPFDNAPDKRLARVRANLPPERPIAIYTGHLYDYKGIGPLLDAARVLPEVLFLLVGGWPDDVKRWKRASAGLDNVRFEGFVPNAEIPGWLAAADMCIHPHSARHDYATWTSPLKLLEYMASGRPIVATDIPGLHDLLVHEGNAIVVPADDPERLTEGIRRVLDDPQLAQRLARQARSDVDRFTWKNRAQAILERFAPDLL